MGHEPLDVVRGLGRHFRAERLFLRVCRAREREVLPHEQSAFVTQVVKGVVLIDPAAPDPDEVAPGVERVVEAGGIPAARQERGEAVLRDPVDAAHLHDRAVDDDLEPFAAEGVGRAQLRPPEAGPRVDLVEQVRPRPKSD